MSQKSLNQILLDASIEIVRPSERFSDVKLKYEGKEIRRGNPQECYSKVKREFGIDLKNFE